MKYKRKINLFPNLKRIFIKDINASDRFAAIMTVLIWLFMFIYSLSLLFLYLWAFMSSFNNIISFGLSPFNFPNPLTTRNYDLAFNNMVVTIFKNGQQENQYIETLLANTGIYIIIASIVATFTPCFVAYVVARFDFKFNRILDGIVVVTMILPIVNAQPSEISIIKAIGLYDNYLGLAFMRMTFLGTPYLIYKSAFKGVDKAYREAAFIDGAGYLKVMLWIDMPMIANIITIFYVLQAMGFWGDWMFPMIYLPSHPTVAYGLYQLQFTHEPDLIFEGVKFAACFMASLPTLLIFILFREKMMGGLSFGGIKG